VWLALVGSHTLAAVAFGVALRTRRVAHRQAGKFAEVAAAALTDPLTSALNRRGFDEAVEREIARARRHGHRFVLAYIDVRGLKRVNDSEGHLAGDQLLKEVADLLKDCARADDVVGRIGGDEFGILLTEADGADAVTSRIDGQVPVRREALGFGPTWGLTIGTATFAEDGETLEELVAVADRRLYEKRGIELQPQG
jgi:diguanylate cyclase (GGDEF)-like protein